MSDTDTRWIKYHICDKSGGGWNIPNYVFGISKDESNSSIQDIIIEQYEDWAQFAENFSFKCESNITPPVIKIQEIIAEKEEQIKDLQDELELLRFQLFQGEQK